MSVAPRAPDYVLVDALQARVKELEAAIRNHRDQRGDDRCWMDDQQLYRVLPEGVPEEALALPPPEVMLANCARYVASRHQPGVEYVSPQRRVEELEAELADLRDVSALADAEIAKRQEQGQELFEVQAKLTAAEAKLVAVREVLRLGLDALLAAAGDIAARCLAEKTHDHAALRAVRAAVPKLDEAYAALIQEPRG